MWAVLFYCQAQPSVGWIIIQLVWDGHYSLFSNPITQPGKSQNELNQQNQEKKCWLSTWVNPKTLCTPNPNPRNRLPESKKLKWSPNSGARKVGYEQLSGSRAVSNLSIVYKILPSSAQAPAQARLCWFYSQLLRPAGRPADQNSTF